VRIDPGSNAALFLQLGLPSTIIRHKNRAFKKALFKREEAENETPAFHFRSDGKKFENRASENDDVTIIM